MVRTSPTFSVTGLVALACCMQAACGGATEPDLPPSFQGSFPAQGTEGASNADGDAPAGEESGNASSSGASSDSNGSSQASGATPNGEANANAANGTQNNGDANNANPSASTPSTADDTPSDSTPDTQQPDEPASEDPTPAAIPSGGSPGCTGNLPDPATLNILATIISLPDGYDGTTPVPVAFGFHGAGRSNEQMREVDSRTANSVLEQNYVMAYMKSQGNAWDVGADYPRFEQALDQVLSQLCIDTSAIFAFGHSSGAQFIAQILGDNRARETRFAAIVPVASSRYFNPAWSPVPTFAIHGLNDTSRGGDPDGAQDILQYTESNQCTDQTQAVNVPTCGSFADNSIQVNPGCKTYVGCASPVQFCQHDDPNYYNNGDPNQATNHGWPCFATQAIFDFFESVR